MNATSDGVSYFPHYLPLERQRDLVNAVMALGAGESGFYTPIVRGGKPMSVRMMCLGQQWNARTYRYEPTRADIDGRPVLPVPPDWVALAREIGGAAGFDVTPDVCIVNWYRAGSRMGLHQDKDESATSLAAGVPVVSISLGDTGRFLFGGLRRRDPVETVMLESGDAFVFGGPARLRYHGVSRIIAGTAPPELSLEGRLNLTFRKY